MDDAKKDHELLSLLVKLLSIPGGAAVLEKLPNGKLGIGFRYVPKDAK